MLLSRLMESILHLPPELSKPKMSTACSPCFPAAIHTDCFPGTQGVQEKIAFTSALCKVNDNLLQLFLQLYKFILWEVPLYHCAAVSLMILNEQLIS